MNGILKIYTDKKNNLFQTPIWQETQKESGLKSWLLPCDEGDTLLVKMPFFSNKSFLYAPRGPACSEEGWHVFLKKAKEIASEENAVFVRVEPLVVPNGILKTLKFKKVSKYSLMSRQKSPENTLLLDIRGEEEQILGQMKPKGRYNIRLAQRKGVKVRKSVKEEDLKTFYRMSVAMKERGFSSFSFEHYQALLDTLSVENKMTLLIAEYKKKPLAAILVSFYNEVATYLHGASSDEDRELMPNHLLQWEAILEAKKRNCQIYDFWGIAPTDDEKHPWAGITRFKKSFGGEPVQFLGAYDFTYQPVWYRIFFLLGILRKVIKR